MTEQERELRSMEAVWDGRLGRGVRIRFSVRIEYPYGSDAAAYRGLMSVVMPDGQERTLMLSPQRPTEDDAWRALLSRYSDRSPRRRCMFWYGGLDRTLFPPCSSAEELRLRLAVTGEKPDLFVA